jgi:hypothetical protein
LTKPFRNADQNVSASDGPRCRPEPALRPAQPDRGDLAPAFGIHRHRDYGGHRHDPAALAHLQVRCVEPEVGPFAFQGPLQEGVHALVDVLAELGDGALGDAREAHGLDEIVHPRRVETPPIQASWTTATSAFSLTFRGSRKGGKYEPWRSLGMRSWSVPSRVSSARSRYPLR